MVRKERTAEEAAEKWLKTYPFHIIVKIPVSCMEAHIYLFLPVSFCFFQESFCFISSIVFFKELIYFLFLICNAKHKNIAGLFSGIQD